MEYSSRLAPQFESEDLHVLGNGGVVSNEIVDTMRQGLSVMTGYFGFEDIHEKEVVRKKKALKINFIIAIILTVIICSPILFLKEDDIGSLQSIPLESWNWEAYLPIIFFMGVFYLICMAMAVNKPNFHEYKFEMSLKAICNEMNVDYYSTGLEGHREKGSTWFGMGTIGITVAVIGNIVGGLNAANKNKHYKTLSLVCSYNQIADYFNQTYFPEEYEALPQKISLS
jgi:hypothetical protein